MATQVDLGKVHWEVHAKRILILAIQVRSGWTGLRPAWSSWRCSCLLQGGLDQMAFKCPSQSKPFYDSIWMLCLNVQWLYNRYLFPFQWLETNIYFHPRHRIEAKDTHVFSFFIHLRHWVLPGSIPITVKTMAFILPDAILYTTVHILQMIWL